MVAKSWILELKTVLVTPHGACPKEINGAPSKGEKLCRGINLEVQILLVTDEFYYNCAHISQHFPHFGRRPFKMSYI